MTEVQPILPFEDLPPIECKSEDSVSRFNAGFFGSKHEPPKETTDATLLFMTLAVTLTGQNEMPIVAPYQGPIPAGVLGIHRTSKSTPSTIAPHFYMPDRKIRSFWNHPFRTEKKVERFVCSIGTDFSMTFEMGRPQKMYASFLNKLWVAWMQSRGHRVIPNISFPEDYMEDYWIEGWPSNSVVAVNSVGILTHGRPDVWLKGVERIRKELTPTHILRYGPFIPGENREGCSYFANDNNMAANGR